MTAGYTGSTELSSCHLSLYSLIPYCVELRCYILMEHQIVIGTNCDFIQFIWTVTSSIPITLIAAELSGEERTNIDRISSCWIFCRKVLSIDKVQTCAYTTLLLPLYTFILIVSFQYLIRLYGLIIVTAVPVIKRVLTLYTRGSQPVGHERIWKMYLPEGMGI